MKRSLATLVALLAMLPAISLAEGTLSPEALAIANDLNCPVCQGQSARDSNSQVARQMREIIQQQLDQGKTRQQIIDYFVQRYGESVLREPPKSGFALTLWWVPVIGLAVGVLVLGTFIIQRRDRALVHQATAPVTDDEQEIRRYEEQLRQELRGLDRGI